MLWETYCKQLITTMLLAACTLVFNLIMNEKKSWMFAWQKVHINIGLGLLFFNNNTYTNTHT